MKEKNSGRLSAWLAGIAAWFVLLGCLLGGVYFLTHAYGFYEIEYARYDAASDIGVSYENLLSITRGVLGYLNGERENLDMQTSISGEWAEVFSQREKDHMVDVQLLIRQGRAALFICIAASAALLAWAIALAARNRTGRRLCIGYLIGAGAFLLVTAVIAVCFLVDFTHAFYTFHRIFFRNDLWMLPSDAVLIKMVPEQFFSDCALVLAAFFLGGLVLTSLAALICALRLHGGEESGKGTRIRTTRHPDGGKLYEIESEETDRPDAERIFERMGLQEQQDDSAAPETVPQRKAADAPTTVRSNTNLRLEMKLDLCIVQTGDGLELVPDPQKPLDIRVKANKGELNMLVQALENGQDRIRLNAPTEPQQEDKEEDPLETEIFQGEYGKILENLKSGTDHTEVPSDPQENLPSVEDLLKRMNDLMQWFPEDGGEERKP